VKIPKPRQSRVVIQKAPLGWGDPKTFQQSPSAININFVTFDGGDVLPHVQQPVPFEAM